MDSILEFGVERFGPEHTARFLQRLTRRFSAIAESPRRYPAVDDLRPGFRRPVFESHAIYYRVDDAGVLIVRVLGRQQIDPAEWD